MGYCKIVGHSEILSVVAQKTSKWAIYLKPGVELETYRLQLCKSEMPAKEADAAYEVAYQSACPWADGWLITNTLLEGFVIALFDHEDDALIAYDSVLGDDGRTTTGYNGDYRIYTMLADANGNILNENT